LDREMTDDVAPSTAKATRTYPTDVSKAMQLLLAKKITDADAVVQAFAEVRDDAARVERARLLAWLKERPCPTPATWAALAEAIERGEHRDGGDSVMKVPAAAPVRDDGEG